MTMLERVACEIYGEGTLEGLGKHVSRIMLSKASAVVKAMREPSEGMVYAGADFEVILCDGITIQDARAIYQAMIDQILKGEGGE